MIKDHAYVMALVCALGVGACAQGAQERSRALALPEALPVDDPPPAWVVLQASAVPPRCEQECARQRERVIGYPSTPKERDEALAALSALCDDGEDGACRISRVVVPTKAPRVERSHELRFHLADRQGEIVMSEVRCGMHQGRLLPVERLVHDLDFFAKRSSYECPVEEKTSIIVEVSFEAGQVMGLVAGEGASDETLACVRRAAEHSKTSIDGVCAGTLELRPRAQ